MRMGQRDELEHPLTTWDIVASADLPDKSVPQDYLLDFWESLGAVMVEYEPNPNPDGTRTWYALRPTPLPQSILDLH